MLNLRVIYFTLLLSVILSNYTIKAYDQINNSVRLYANGFGTSGTVNNPQNAISEKNTVTYKRGECTASKNIVVEVYDPNNSCLEKIKIYPNKHETNNQQNVENINFATDGNPKTFSKLNLSLDLLNLSKNNITLQWQTDIPANKTIYIKLGIGNSLLGVGNTLTLQQKLNNNNVGNLQYISGGLIELLAGENEIIYSFVTSSTINKITIELGSILGLSLSAKIFEAWHEGYGNTCPSQDIFDVLSGSAEIIKGVLNAATTTVGTTNPTYAIDSDHSTYASMFSGAGIAAYAKLDVIFSSISQPGDSIFITVQNSVEILNLQNGFIIQRYLGNTPIGLPISFGSSLLSLLKNVNNKNIILSVTDEPYDRIAIRYGGVANVLGELKIYDIHRKPYVYTYASIGPKQIDICEKEPIYIGNNNPCLEYFWYTSLTATSPIFTSKSGQNSNTPFIPTGIGQRTYYVQQKRNNCTFGPKMPLTVNVSPLHGKPHITIYNIIN